MESHKQMDKPACWLVRSAAAGTVVYSPGGTYGPRLQTDLQIVLLHSGAMSVTIDGAAENVPAGHAILLRPGHLESFRFSEEQETWHRWIAVHLELPPDDAALAVLDSMPRITPISEPMSKLTDLMLSVQQELPSDSDVMRSLGLSAIHLFAADKRVSDDRHDVHPSVQAAKQLIHERYGEELSLHILASHVNVSAEHLVRLFRSSVSMTPVRYVWHYRVLKAQELLVHTGLTITEIAQRCGFKTSYHFARVIKRETGRTPSGLRHSAWTGALDRGEGTFAE